MTTICDKAMDFGECLSLPSSPPHKRARVEIEADEYEETFDQDKDDIDSVEADEYEKVFKKFKEEFRKSEGFDIQTYPDLSKIIGGVRKTLFDLKDAHPDMLDEFLFYKFGCIFSLKYAINMENKKQKKKITLEKIIKSNNDSGDVFYTTFLAKDEDTGESKIYQTAVWFSLIHGEAEVSIFRERADQALQPGEDTQGVDMEVFPNLPAPNEFRPVNLDNYALGEDSYYLSLCHLSTKHALREMNQKESKVRGLTDITESTCGGELSFRTTFTARDVKTDECQTFYVEMFFNMQSGELEMQKWEEVMPDPNKGILPQQHLVASAC